MTLFFDGLFNIGYIPLIFAVSFWIFKCGGKAIDIECVVIILVFTGVYCSVGWLLHRFKSGK